MYAPTYIVLPFIAVVCFFVAAFPAWIAVAQFSPLGATGLAVLWVVLLVAMRYDDQLDVFFPVVAAILTMVLGRVAARALASEFNLPQPLTEVVLVETVMFLLAVVNLAFVWRDRARLHGMPPH